MATARSVQYGLDMTRTDLDILAANEHTKWDAIVIASETTHRGERTRFLASSGYGPHALSWCRAQVEYSDEGTVYERTKRNTWRKRRA
jgi:hypothetical protein